MKKMLKWTKKFRHLKGKCNRTMKLLHLLKSIKIRSCLWKWKPSWRKQKRWSTLIMKIKLTLTRRVNLMKNVLAKAVAFSIQRKDKCSSSFRRVTRVIADSNWMRDSQRILKLLSCLTPLSYWQRTLILRIYLMAVIQSLKRIQESKKRLRERRRRNNRNWIQLVRLKGKRRRI